MSLHDERHFSDGHDHQRLILIMFADDEATPFHYQHALITLMMFDF